ncbi:hypothetical protein BU14_0066s0028 [Porphyra umbilicalis]|uniref:non-specific serine/threonine protein kinase n=1 Tax=Porphyra umbilicalis TaxID=2786 RepID=A0A1X6PGU0_PORUM|nr:hypothetical protein BU14_0066s0028 [Porphyra umbilicalis]|eukprot:OSX79976.1 hypothetical protein BU14_0066s0028 [Porphyra umbilicalis]
MDRTIASAETTQDRLDARRRAVRTADKADRATAEQVLDPRTRLLLFEMLSRGRLASLAGVVSTGKEANVYYGTGPLVPHGVAAPTVSPPKATTTGSDAAAGDTPDDPGGADDLDVGDYTPTPFGGIAVKVFKTAILDFKDRRRYVEGDQRFKSGYTGNSRKMVALWAEKEYANLRRLHKARVPVPLPLFLKPPVLGMAFVGADGWPAPLLKDALPAMAAATPGTGADVAGVYVQVAVAMRRMYAGGRLVHGDLSEYNLLYDGGRIVVIDVSQSVEADHPNALEFLRADCVNVSAFFRRVWGVRGAAAAVAVAAAPAGADTRGTPAADTAASADAGEGGGGGGDDGVGGAVLSPPALFAFVTAPDADPPSDPDGRARLADAMAAAAAAPSPTDEDARGVEEAVWQRSYMPVTLKEVADVEADTALMAGGGETPYAEMMGLAIRHAAAAAAAAPANGGGAASSSADEDSDDDGDGDGNDSDSTGGSSTDGGDGRDGSASDGSDGGGGSGSVSDGDGGRRRVPVAERTGDAKSLARAGMTKAEWKAAVKAEQRERREAKTPKKVKRRKEAVAKRRRHVKVKK